MTAEQLEELLADLTHVSKLRRDSAHDDLSALAPSLARRVLAAEKLVEAGRVMANALKGDYIVPGSARAWDDAEAAYREAGK